MVVFSVEKKKPEVVKLTWYDGSWTHTYSITAKSLHKVHKVRFRWSLLFPAPVLADCQFEDNFCGWKSFSPEGEGGWKWSSGNLNSKGKIHWCLVRVVGDYFSGADRQFRRIRLCPLLFLLSRPFIFYILEAESTFFFSEVKCPEASWLYTVLSLYDSLDNWNRDILIFAYSFTQNAFRNYQHFFAIRFIRLPGRTTWCSAGDPCVAMETCVWRTWVLPPVPTLFAGQVWLI